MASRPLLSPRRPPALSLHEAAESSPTLSGLMARVREAQACLQAIRPLLPPGLRAGVQAGPVEEGRWCLLVDGSATAAKLRQMTPMLLAHLRSQGFGIDALRIKVRGRA
ncbi:DciA family protein [Xenophilus sp.]|jgi:hypothetical protein|uniref:DciA family protein n=1 Tax=Xenophilus sp. TaxID=1873499 RepID=UPI0037DDBEB6